MKLEIICDDRNNAILVCDERHCAIAEFFHSEHATVTQSYETALALAKQLVATCSESGSSDDPSDLAHTITRECTFPHCSCEKRCPTPEQM